MLTIVFFMQLFWTTSNAQEDSVCYSRDQNIKIATKLVEGYDCSIELIEVRKSYEDAKTELRMYAKTTEQLNSDKTALESQKAKLEKQKKRRNIWIWVLSSLLVITTSQL